MGGTTHITWREIGAFVSENQKPARNVPKSAWKPGTSGGGRRPPSTRSLSEAFRRGLDVNELVEYAMAQLNDDKLPSAVRLQWWQAITAWGWSKPPAQAELVVSATVTPTLPQGWTSMPAAAREQFLAQLAAKPLPMLDVGDDDESSVQLDGAQTTDNAETAFVPTTEPDDA